MDYREELINQVRLKRNQLDIIKHLYLIRPTCSFHENYDKADDILTEVSNFFKISISSIVVCGSAKLGFSLAKGTNFTPGSSDLDLAIIDAHIFSVYFDAILEETRNYSRGDLFIGNNLTLYKKFVTKGMINPKYMPDIKIKRDLINFSQELSIKYRSLFESVSICFYLTEKSFQNKQISGLTTWLNDKPDLIGELTS